MTTEQKCIYARDVLKWTCDKEGNVYNKKGRKIGCINKRDGYLISNFKVSNKSYNIRLHQYIYWLLNSEIPECIDHINLNKTDNRIENLRRVTKQQNCFNNRAKGFYYNVRAKKYHSIITYNKTRVHLGYFVTEQEARQAYLEAKKIYHKI